MGFMFNGQTPTQVTISGSVSTTYPTYTSTTLGLAPATGSTSRNLLTVPANKKARLVGLTVGATIASAMGANVSYAAIKANGVIVAIAAAQYAGATTAQNAGNCLSMNFAYPEAIQLSAGQSFTLDSGDSNVYSYGSITYILEDA